jgi:hypothetical protein
MPRALNPRVSFRTTATAKKRAADASARFTHAENKSVDHAETERRAYLIGLRELELCELCAASKACKRHSVDLLIDAEPPTVPPRWTPEERTATIDCYFRVFERAMGVKPVFGPREGKAINQLLERMSAAEAARAIERAYADPFWASRKGTTILRIAADPSAFLGSTAPTSTFQQAPRGKRSWPSSEVKSG